MRIRYYTVAAFVAMMTTLSSCDKTPDLTNKSPAHKNGSALTRAVSESSIMTVIRNCLSDYVYNTYSINNETRFFQDLGLDEYSYYLFLEEVYTELKIQPLFPHTVYITVRDLINYILGLLHEYTISLSLSSAIGPDSLPISLSCSAQITYADDMHSTIRSIESSQCILTSNSLITNQEGNDVLLQIINPKTKIINGRDIEFTINILYSEYTQNGNNYSQYRIVNQHPLNGGFDFVHGPTLIYTPSGYNNNELKTVSDLVLDAAKRVFNDSDIITSTLIGPSGINASESQIIRLASLIGERLHTTIPISFYSIIPTATIQDIINYCVNLTGVSSLSYFRDRQDTYDTITALIAEECDVNAYDIGINDSLMSLGIDSTAILGIIMEIDTQLDITTPIDHIQVFINYDVNEIFRYYLTFPE